MSNTNDKTVYILDSYGLIYRAYFALISHPLTNSRGENIGALSIFFRNLKALLAKYKPAYLAAAFDSRTPTFRHEMYAEYKATRQKTPDDLHAQVPWIEDVLNELKVPVLRVDGFEADDIIATVAKKCREENRPCRILSGDKDLLQLVNEQCKEMQPDKFNGGWMEEGIEEVIAKWGIPPEKILDYLSLVGDSADNVPGVSGVGDKTALKLLNEWGTLDGIYEHADEIKGALGEKIRKDKENAYFSKKLITLRDDVPVEIDFNDFSTANLDYSAAAKKLNFHEAFSVAKSYATTEAGPLFSQDGKTASDGEPDSEEKTVLEVKQNHGNYSAVTNIQELKKIIDEVLSSKEKCVAFDTETDGLDSISASLVGFSLCNKTGTAVYVPVYFSDMMFAPEAVPKEECIRELSRLLDNGDLTLIMHNGKFDLEVLWANGYTGIPKCKIFDTMVAAWLLSPDEIGKSPYSLEYLGETKLGLRGIEFKDVVSKGKTFADVRLEDAVPYAAEDADFTWQLKAYFDPLIEKNSLHELFYDMEMKILPILARMEKQGIHLDKKALAEYNVYLTKEIEEKEKAIHKEAGHEFNIASPKQLQTVLFEERQLVPGKKTKTGYSTDTAVLEELIERTEDPLPRLILDYRSLTKLQGTYVETLPTLADKESRIHTTFLQTGTATGRLSSRDPNLQNIPIRDEAGRRIRSAFTAVPGTVLISADYAQIELVVLAHLSLDKNLCSAFNQGVDVHKATAALINRIEPDQVSPEMRRMAKTVNFGVMYGMSAFRLANELGISRTQAKEFIEKYFETYSGVRKFLDDTIASAKQNGYVETILQRKRRISNINSRNKIEQNAAQRIAVNTPIQGSAADIVKTAMMSVQKAIDEDDRLKDKIHLLLQVHDELIFECKDDRETVEYAISVIRSKMEGAVKLNVPLKVSIESGSNWGDFH
ncbi:MAG: DNA polymerase I [Treponema sp.]|nr:DNA polymerase I [Treponema sp.]